MSLLLLLKSTSGSTPHTLEIPPNSLATQFDVQLTFYAGLEYDELNLSDYTEGYTNTTGWTDVTSYIKSSGNMTYSRDGSALGWRATVNGNDYDDSYFGVGKAIMCFWRVTVCGVQTFPVTGNSVMWFVGQIINVNYSDEYTHRGAWSCTIGGVDTLLQRATAPHITAGKINLLSNATVEASSTLLIPALEANTGEFPGTLVNVDPENTIDSNVNTLWISNEPITTTSTVELTGISKLFLDPIPGYDRSKLWWFEYTPGESIMPVNQTRITNSDDVSLWVPAWEYTFESGKHYVICANKENFEAYNGTSEGVEAIIDVRTLHQTSGSNDSDPDVGPHGWKLDANAGWFVLFSNQFYTHERAAIAWNTTGSNEINTVPWSGDSINVSTGSPGYGWVARGDAVALNTGSSYIADRYIHPGHNYSSTNREWLLYTLESQSAVLSASTASGAASISLTSTLGLLDAGSAICESDIFSYTGRTTVALTGIPTSGSLAISDHANGAAVNQMIDDVMQTGWPCTQLEMFRPHNANLERILHGEVYTARTGAVAPRNPDETDWELDYDNNIVNFAIGGGAGYDYSTTLVGTTDGTGPRWIQYLLLYFKQMSNSSRARMNEVKLSLSQTQVDRSGLGDINLITAGQLARYIFSQAGTSTYISDGTSPDFGPLIGEHSVAIAPYTEVLEDLARITGCVIDWSMCGMVYWWHDMWWPMNYDNSYHWKFAVLDANYLRGDISYSGIKPNETGVKIGARTPDSVSRYNAEFPAGMTAAQQKIEYDDLVLADSNLIDTLAQTMYYKNGLFYIDGAQECTFTLTGVGEWLRPELWIQIYTNTDTGKVGVIPVGDSEANHSYVSWLIDSVSWDWGMNDKVKTWQANVRCRRYWQV